ncbi:PE family protein, partial [Mycobacterium lacus]
MSFVIAAPEMLAAAAADLAGIGSAVGAANAAALAPTTSVLAAAADEVSTAVAALFSGHAQAYQALSAQAGAFHAQFVAVLNAGAGSYLQAEATNAEQNLLNAVNAPAQAVLGRPLIGDGAAGGPGQDGGAGGLLFGNGGRGGD